MDIIGDRNADINQIVKVYEPPNESYLYVEGKFS